MEARDLNEQAMSAVTKTYDPIRALEFLAEAVDLISKFKYREASLPEMNLFREAIELLEKMGLAKMKKESALNSLRKVREGEAK